MCPPAAGAPRPGEENTIFVKGFDSSLGEDAVREALTETFSKYGKVNQIRCALLAGSSGQSSLPCRVVGGEQAMMRKNPLGTDDAQPNQRDFEKGLVLGPCQAGPLWGLGLLFHNQTHNLLPSGACEPPHLEDTEGLLHLRTLNIACIGFLVALQPHSLDSLRVFSRDGPLTVRLGAVDCAKSQADGH